jgi:hypothetical protein
MGGAGGRERSSRVATLQRCAQMAKADLPRVFWADDQRRLWTATGKHSHGSIESLRLVRALGSISWAEADFSLTPALASLHWKTLTDKRTDNASPAPEKA